MVASRNRSTDLAAGGRDEEAAGDPGRGELLDLEADGLQRRVQLARLGDGALLRRPPPRGVVGHGARDRQGLPRGGWVVQLPAACRGKVRVEWNLWVALRGLPELPLPLTDRSPHWDCRVSRLSSSPNSHLWPGQARVVARWFLVTAAGTNQPEPCGLLSDWRPGPGYRSAAPSPGLSLCTY